MQTAVVAHGAVIPAIGLGTWQMRGAECARVVADALSAGYRHIDTAAMYDNEAAVGEGLRTAGVPRDQVFVTTKVWPSNIGDGALQRSVEESVRRLKVDAVDLVLIHWPSRRIPLGESMAALSETRRRGLTRHIGVSNFDAALTREAWSLSEAPLVANQCEYHPYLAQDEVIAACRSLGIAFVAYSPLARRDILDEPVIQDIAQRLGRTPAQIVLRWLIQQDGVVAIPKSSRPARIRQNLQVFDFDLAKADMDEIASLARMEGVAALD